MSNLDAYSESPQWKAQPTWERISICRSMLYIHGFLSEAENRKVVARIEKWALAAKEAKLMK